MLGDINTVIVITQLVRKLPCCSYDHLWNADRQNKFANVFFFPSQKYPAAVAGLTTKIINLKQHTTHDTGRQVKCRQVKFKLLNSSQVTSHFCPRQVKSQVTSHKNWRVRVTDSDQQHWVHIYRAIGKKQCVLTLNMDRYALHIRPYESYWNKCIKSN